MAFVQELSRGSQEENTSQERCETQERIKDRGQRTKVDVIMKKPVFKGSFIKPAEVVSEFLLEACWCTSPL